VLLVLAVTVAWPGGWWLDPVLGLGIAAVAGREGLEAWRGEEWQLLTSTPDLDEPWARSGWLRVTSR